MKTADLEAEHRAAVKNLTTEDAKELVDQLLIPFFLVIIHQMVGILAIRESNRLWEPDGESAQLAYITPLRIDDWRTPLSPEPWGAPRCGELVDLIAWRPENPHRWALRTGLSPWLGAVPRNEPFPALIRATPLSWLQGNLDGLVLFTRQPSQLRAILGELEYGIRAETPELAQRLDHLIRQPLDKLPHITAAPPGLRLEYQPPPRLTANYTPLREEDA